MIKMAVDRVLMITVVIVGNENNSNAMVSDVG